MKESSDAKPSRNEALSQKLGEQVFVALQAKKALQQPLAHTKPVLFADIVSYVMGKSDNADGVRRAINDDLSKRRIYQQVLNQSRFAVGLREAHAKSTGEIELRRGEGFVVKFKISRTNAQQCYVILLIDETLLKNGFLNQDENSVVMHIEGEDDHHSILFPPLFAGKSQLIMAADDEALLMLKDINNQLSLCCV